MDKADPVFTATATAIRGRNRNSRNLGGQARIACRDLDEYVPTVVRARKPKTGGSRS